MAQASTSATTTSVIESWSATGRCPKAIPGPNARVHGSSPIRAWPFLHLCPLRDRVGSEYWYASCKLVGVFRMGHRLRGPARGAGQRMSPQPGYLLGSRSHIRSSREPENHFNARSQTSMDLCMPGARAWTWWQARSPWAAPFALWMD